MAICDHCDSRVRTVHRQRIDDRVIYRMCEVCVEVVNNQAALFEKEEIKKLERVNK